MRATRNASKNTPPPKKAGTPKGSKPKVEQSSKGTPKAEKADAEPVKAVETIEIEDEPEGVSTEGDTSNVNGETKFTGAEAGATDVDRADDEASKLKHAVVTKKAPASKKKGTEGVEIDADLNKEATEADPSKESIEGDLNKEVLEAAVEALKHVSEGIENEKVQLVEEIKAEVAITKEVVFESVIDSIELVDLPDEDYSEVEKEDSEEDDDNEEDEEEVDEDGDDEGEGDGFLSEQRPVSDRHKRRKLEVFVGGLDKEATEEDVRATFQTVGEVLEVRLRTNPQTGKNRGYAFVRFATQEQAKKAAVELERTKIRDKECNVVPSEDNDTLYIGNLCKSWKSDQILDKLKEYGIEGIDEITLLEDSKSEGSSRGFAFLDFLTHNDAVNAFKRLSRPDAIFGSDYSAKVAWAEPFVEPDEAAMAKVKSVYVDSLPLTWGESKLKELFSAYGNIEGVVMSKNMPRSKRQDFAFIDYATRDAALACIEALNDTEVADGESKIKLKVELSKPAPRKKHRKGFRGSYPVGGGSLKQKSKSSSARGGLNRRGRGGRGLSGGFVKRKAQDDDRLYQEDRSKNKRTRGFRAGTGGNRRDAVRTSYPRFEERRSHSQGRGGYARRGGGVFRDDYFTGGAAGTTILRSRGYSDRPLREEAYPQRPERGYAYEMAYGEASLGIKRPYSALDEEATYYESVRRGYPRARVDYAELSVARAPLAHSSLGSRSGLPVIGGASALYGSSMLPVASDYVSGAVELRGAPPPYASSSTLYGDRSGYGLPGAGGSSYY